MTKTMNHIYIEYMDANNLYGWARSQKLLVNVFKWLKQKNYQNFMKTS